MTNKAQHTPTPWHHAKVNGNSIIYDSTFLNRHLFISSNGGVPENEDSANAAFIVKAVNCHDELVRALVESYGQIKETLTILKVPFPEDSFKRYEAILAKTKGDA